MKLTSFNCTIELSKDENGYSNNYYVDVNEKGVNISHPYITMQPEEAEFVIQLIHDFIGRAIDFNRRIDGFNRDIDRKKNAIILSSKEVFDALVGKTSAEEIGESAVAQPSRGGSDPTDLVTHSEQEQERLDMEELEARETGSDKA